MKAFALILTTLLVWAPLASADNIGTFFGSMATAHATGKGQTTVSGTFGFTDVTTHGGSLGYGFTDKMDGRIRIEPSTSPGSRSPRSGRRSRWQL
jgi:hypothetical protein